MKYKIDREVDFFYALIILENARKNFDENLVQRFESMGTVFKPEQRENLIKQQIDNKLNENPIELEN